MVKILKELINGLSDYLDYLFNELEIMIDRYGAMVIKFLMSIAICGIFFLGGVHMGRIDGENMLLDVQEISAQALADDIVARHQCKIDLVDTRNDVGNFNHGVCKQLLLGWEGYGTT